MSTDFYVDLQWLPPPSPAVSAEIAKLGPATPDPGRTIRHLAGFRLTEGQSIKLNRATRALRAAGAKLDGLTPFRLALLSNGTTDFVAAAIEVAALRWGLNLSVIVPPFNQAVHEAMDPASATNVARPDAVLFALDHRALPLDPKPGDAASSRRSVDECCAHIAMLAELTATHSGALPIIQTIAPPPERLFGNFERRVEGTRYDLITKVNRRLVEIAGERSWPVLDVAGLADTVGSAAWHDVTQWAWAKLPFSQRLAPLYGDHVARVAAAVRGRTRKVLVLDCDNTLWGGVIGDDGLEGIALGQGSAAGEVFIELQRYALELRDRGIVLAICSKNDDAVARKVFREHPEMLLREEHIAVFQANWEDKAANLKAIAETLALGIDSLVFVDDNPFEREFVRKALPDVAVPEIGDDAGGYARMIAAAGYFEAVGFSAEDRARADQYASNAKRAQIQAASGGLDAYLESLDMRIHFAPFDAVGRVRIAQLINKSNQFNLTTRRYSESEVAALESARSVFTLQVRLVDSLGDNGMISVIICRQNGVSWEIDTWLMSCRVLKRRVEEAVLQEISRAAREAGATKLTGWYRPTDKNGLVADHYGKLGFSMAERGPDGASRWELDVSEQSTVRLPFTTIRAG